MIAENIEHKNKQIISVTNITYRQDICYINVITKLNKNIWCYQKECGNDN